MGKLKAANKAIDALADKVSELIRLGFPESTAKKIASGELPMDQASRMARAREQGFDVDQTLYHGTDADISEFTPSKRGKMGSGVYLTPSADYASRYAGDDGNIMPLLSRGEIAGMSDRSAASEAARIEAAGGGVQAWKARTNEILQDQGFSGAQVQDEVLTFDPSNIRSTNAAFDPDQTNSSNLLAGLGAAGVGIGLAGQSEDADAGVMYEPSPLEMAASGFLASRQEKKPQWDAMRADLLNAMSNAASFGLDAIEIPWKGILGATRVAGGLASGESFNNAMFAGANQVRQQVDQTADDLGGAVVDYTGSPALGTAVNVGVNMGGPI